MKNVLQNARMWGIGVALAAIGVLVARVVGPRAAESLRLPVVLGGELLAVCGLFVICVGVSRRVRPGQDAGEIR